MSTLTDTAQELRYVQAINSALADAMEKYPDLIVLGEDVGIPGGVFGATKGLWNEHPDRVLDTPISESAILGTGIGAAMEGVRSVVEIMWSDFSLVALDQVYNQAANIQYVSCGQLTVPLTIRMQQGAIPGSCAQHSQHLESLFAFRPGLTVAVPSTPQDVYDVLTTSIAIDSPSVVVEARALYGTVKAPVERHGTPVKPGISRTVRDGSDATIVTWGPISHKVAEAADTLAAEGVDVEVIDLLWLRPWDSEAVLQSVRRTGRLLVVHEAWQTGGFGAEVVAHVAQHAHGSLKAAPSRLAGAEVPMPAAGSLQARVLPSTDTITAAVRHLMS